jgi:hypothetical protein
MTSAKETSGTAQFRNALVKEDRFIRSFRSSVSLVEVSLQSQIIARAIYDFWWPLTMNHTGSFGAGFIWSGGTSAKPSVSNAVNCIELQRPPKKSTATMRVLGVPGDRNAQAKSETAVKSPFPTSTLRAERASSTAEEMRFCASGVKRFVKSNPSQSAKISQTLLTNVENPQPRRRDWCVPRFIRTSWHAFFQTFLYHVSLFS